jgi:hypothetical protein
MQFAETGKIHRFNEQSGRTVHQVKIRSVGQEPGIVSVEYALIQGNIVLIRSCSSGKTGMSIRLDWDNLMYSYILGQYPVQFAPHPVTVMRLIQVKMRHHLRRMHTGIGTSGTCNAHLLAKEQSQGLLQSLLNGR